MHTIIKTIIALKIKMQEAWFAVFLQSNHRGNCAQIFKVNEGQFNPSWYHVYFCHTIECDNMITPLLWFQEEKNMGSEKSFSEFPVAPTWLKNSRLKNEKLFKIHSKKLFQLP